MTSRIPFAGPAWAARQSTDIPAARSGRRRAAAVAALIWTTLFGACAPIVSHGPRVRDGTAAGIGGAVLSDLDGDPMEVVVPYLTVGKDRGGGNGGRQFTAQILIPTAAFRQDTENDGAIFGIQGDYYRQAPRGDSPFVRGFGVHAGIFQIMPYGQWGVYGDRAGVYTTQGVGVMGPWFGLSSTVLFWSPGFGAEVDVEGVTVRASMSTLVGWRIERMEYLGDVPVSFGIAIEAGPPFARRPAGEQE